LLRLRVTSANYLGRKRFVLAESRPTRAHGESEAGDAVVLQDGDFEICDLRIRQEDQPIIAGRKLDSSLRCAEFRGVESVSSESHELKTHTGVVVCAAERPNSFREGPAEERHVEHATAIGNLAIEVKLSASTAKRWLP